MRTTVRLDDGLLIKAKQEARRQGVTLTNLIERGLRLVMSTGQQRNKGARIELPVSKATGGLLPGVNLDDSKAIWDRLDGIE
jgi:hypothetical protein